MRILILGNNDVGLYKFRRELLETLLKQKNEVFISLPGGPFVKDMTGMGCRFIETQIDRRGTNPVKDLALMKHYDAILKEIRPDVVLTYTIKPNVYGGMACRKNRIPCIANVTGLGSAVENGGLLGRITTFLYKLGLKKADTVFFQNQANLEYMLKNKVVKGNHELIPGSGVNLDRFPCFEYPDHDSVDFVYVGRMMKEKGFGLYIDAARALKEKYPQAAFHVCGSYEDDFREEVDDLITRNIIVYHGLVDDMKEIYRQIDCTIHPTYYPEGMSNVLLESLACGRPIITTDRPGCREIVEDGVNGFVVRQRDQEDLNEKVEKMILLDRETRRQMGLNGRRKVEEEFDRNIVVDHYLKAMERAADHG